MIPSPRMHAKVRAAVGGMLLVGAALGGTYLHHPAPKPQERTISLPVRYYEPDTSCYHPIPADPMLTICG